PIFTLAAALLLAGISMWLASTRLTFRTQRTDLVNPDKEYQQRWQKYLAEFGDDDDMVVLVQGGNREKMTAALEQIAGHIAQHPQLFDRLFYKCDLRGLRNRALLFLPSEQIAAIQGNLQDMKLLLESSTLAGISGWKVLSLSSLLDEAAHRLRVIKENGAIQSGDVTFLTQLNSISHSAAMVIDDPCSYANPWQSILPASPEQKDQLAEPQYFFSGDGTLAFLLVRPVKVAGSFTAANASVTRLREIVDDVKGNFSDLQFGCTGLPILENDEMVASESDTSTASWLALAGISLLYLVVFRGVRYPLLMVGALLMGTAWAMGWLTLTVGHLNILSATFAVMLFGMGDYAVLWVMRYEQARQRGCNVRSALLHTTRHVAVGNLTAATTTALAFFATMFADFKGVAELGWIAGCGILLCALGCFTVLPALLTLLDRRQLVPPTAIPILTSTWLPRLGRRPKLVIGAAVSLAGLAVFGVTQISYDHNLLHLQPRGLDSVQWQMTLIEHTAGASWNALSSVATPAEALALKASYEKLPCVERVVEMASLVPPGQDAKLTQLADVQHRLRRLPPRDEPIPHSKPKTDVLLEKTAHVLADLQGPLPPNDSGQLLTALQGHVQLLHDALAHADSNLAAERILQFDNNLTHDLVVDLHRLRDVSTPAPIKLDDLPPPLRERYLGKSGQWLVQVFAKQSVQESLWDFGPLDAFCKQIQTVDPEATGRPFATVEGLRAMKNGFQWAGFYAFLAIVIVLLFDFRKVGRMLIALAPLALGLLLALGILGLSGVPLNPANIIALPLVLGVGVDNGVHLLHDYLIRRREGLRSVSYPIARGVLVKGLTTMIGFGTLMISSQRGLAGLGLCLTLGVGCCLLASLVFLPAVLMLMGSGKIKQRGELNQCLPISRERVAA
ncbi:MAG TPA: MMPL family transporter, partial [Gemmataceae bacterium]|nr:MMPL family transporter [Gemmataceae bacterium]